MSSQQKNKNKNKGNMPKNNNKKKTKSTGKSNSFLSNLGGLVGSSLGGRPGAMLGSTAGSLMSKIFGLGAYRVNRNTLMTDSNGPPAFGNVGGGTIISHREFLQDISGSVAFTLQNFFINPGLVGTFPWLSIIAINYEQYELLGLVFEYRPTCANSVGTTNTALGTVIMATNYDSLDSNFTNKQQMEAYEFSTSCVPYNAMLHPIECQPRLNSLADQYIRSGAVPANADQRFYDLGNFQIATVGMQAAAVIGELWVTYHVRLLKPKLSTPLGAGLIGAHVVESLDTSATAAAPLGTGGGAVRSGSLLATVTSNTTFTLPSPGRYLIVGGWSCGNGSIAGVPTLSGGSAITAVQNLQDSTGTSLSNFNAGGSRASIITVVDVATAGIGAANTFTIGGLSGMTAAYADVFIQQVSSALTLVNKQERLENEIQQRLARLEDQLGRKGLFIIDESSSSQTKSLIR